MNLLNNQNLDILINISINKIFFNLYFNYEEEKFVEYKIFLINAIKAFNIKFNSNQELIKLLDLFYNKDIFTKMISSHIKNNKTFEIILYGFRYCIQTIYFEEEKIKNEKEINKKKEEKYLYI